MHKGQKGGEENFRNDVNADGHIEHKDIAAHPATTGHLIA